MSQLTFLRKSVFCYRKLNKMKIGILGAGAAGLVSLKYALEEGHEVVCFEKSARLGGCWSGDGRVGKDELGNHISSGMYKGLT